MNTEKLTKKQPINTLKEGHFVNDIFVVKIKKSVSPYSNGHSINLILSDSSGSSIEYKYWGGKDENKVRSIFDSINQDSVVLAKGRVSTYNGKLSINANESDALKVLNPDEYEAEFIMPARKNIDEMRSALESKINSITERYLKEFLLEIFDDGLKEKFKKHPAGIQVHHNWIGGLLEHTLEVIEYCELIAKMNLELNRDLLLAGAVLHDIGKLEEIEITSRIKGSRKGQFVGHIALGIAFLSERLKESRLDEMLKEKLLHLIASHHGKMEYGSPKEPMIPEALALNYADELSSKLSAMLELIKKSKEATEDEFMYDYKNNINIYLR